MNAEGEEGVGEDRRGRRIGWLAHPLPWLLAQALVLWWRCAEAGLLVAERVPDSSGYLNLANLSLDSKRWLEQVLGTTRTYGYPLFLKIAGWASPEHAAVPAAHLVCYIVAILLSWHAFSRYSGRPWLAFWVVTPLFYAGVLSMAGRIQADFLGAAAALASLGLLLWLARRPESVALWSALTASVALTYHVRPAYLFLLPLVPLLGVALRWLLPEERRLRWRWAVGLVLAMVLPFLAYSSLRWAVMGHFGLVSFGGYNLAGVVTPLLDEELIAELPEEDQELGRLVLEKRREIGLETVSWDTPVEHWHGQYNRSVWSAAVPASRQQVRQRWLGQEAAEAFEVRHRKRLKRKAALEGREPTAEERAQWREERRRRRAQRQIRRAQRAREVAALNQGLNQLSRSILPLRPMLYGRWVVGGFFVGVAKAWSDPWVRWPAYGLLATGLAVGGLGVAGRRRTRRRKSPPKELRPFFARLRWTWRSAAMALVAVGYFAAGLGLVVLVEVPFDRYLIALTLLLPGALLAALVEPWLGPAVRTRGV
ncbi:MAG: hypothetical protein SX243_06220 [Acidobacteriota bacterium]|nr:hypothetical protein [Acidobacteriota bacterium]